MKAATSNVSIPFARRDARNGIIWIKRGYAMFRAAPLRWLLLLFTYYLLIGLLEFGPLQAVGQFVAPLLKPVLRLASSTCFAAFAAIFSRSFHSERCFSRA